MMVAAAHLRYADVIATESGHARVEGNVRPASDILYGDGEGKTWLTLMTLTYAWAPDGQHLPLFVSPTMRSNRGHRIVPNYFLLEVVA